MRVEELHVLERDCVEASALVERLIQKRDRLQRMATTAGAEAT
jgi:hypothetical protein